MIRRFTLFVLLLLTSLAVKGQLNVEFVGQLDYDLTLNDIWGYVAPDSTEYALVGLTGGLSIVSLEDPTDPREVAFIEGQTTTWRDIKTWDHYTYVVSDNASDGLLVVDMQYLPDSVQFAYTFGPIDTLGNHMRSHNIYIDEFGLAYLAGSNLGSIIILDVKADPWNPQFVAKTPAPYAHDVYVRDSIVYASEIYEGRMAAYDITRTDSIVLLGSVETPNTFTHNAWLSDDSKTIFTTDERANAFVTSYDISNFNEIKELDRFRPAATLGENVIPHNVHVLNDYLIISYYTDGCIIVDAARPDNLVEVGNYDTFLGASGGFSGAWGAYPFLPSGRVLISDRQTGLYVLAPDYKRACYLEGHIYSAEDPGQGQNISIFDARIEILSDEIVTPESSDLDGAFKMGKAAPGEYTIRVSHPEYIPQEIPLNFVNGEVTEIDIFLQPKQRFQLEGRVVTAADGSPVANARIVATDDFFLYETVANEEGLYFLADVFEGNYRIFAGEWGQYAIEEVVLNADISNDITVAPGYYDDFHFDFGWTVSGTATNGHWGRNEPELAVLFGVFECNPDVDLADDFGEFAFTTGNIPGNAGISNVDEGFTMLSSPVMDLSGMADPVASFHPWLCVRYVEFISLTVLASNGQDTVVIDTIETDGNEGYWRDAVELHLKEFLTPTDSTQLHFVAIDTVGNLVRAALDRFTVFDGQISSTREHLAQLDVRLYPNPTSGHFNMVLNGEQELRPDRWRLINTLGQVVSSGDWPQGQGQLEVVTNVPGGLYFVQLTAGNRLLSTQRLMVSTR